MIVTDTDNDENINDGGNTVVLVIVVTGIKFLLW